MTDIAKGKAMNWSRGLFRLWLGLSVVWVAGGALLFFVRSDIYTLPADYQEAIKTHTVTKPAKSGVKSAKSAKSERGEPITDPELIAILETAFLAHEANEEKNANLAILAAWMFGLPLGTLGFGLFIRWVWRGFTVPTPEIETVANRSKTATLRATMTEAVYGRPTTTMPKRWSERVAAAWGAVLAANVNAIQQVWSPRVSTAETYAGYVAGHIGELFGAALAGAVMFAIATAAMNLVVFGRAPKQRPHA